MKLMPGLVLTLPLFLPGCEVFAPTNPGETVSIVWVRKALEEAIVQLDRADLDKDGEFDSIELAALASNLIARAFQLAQTVPEVPGR